jgi:hypothetical protein
MSEGANRNQVRGALSVLLAALWLLSGCSPSAASAEGAHGGASMTGDAGSSGVTSSSGGSGALAAGSGASGVAGTASAGSGPVLGDSKTEACIAYTMARCARARECFGGSSNTCLFDSFECPDLVFSDGSGQTVADLQACADAYLTFPCERLEKGDLPDCVTPGRRPAGALCAYAMQCASLYCTHQGEGCGVCAEPVLVGAMFCSADQVCREPMSCQSGGTCVAPSVIGKVAGAACMTDANCLDMDCSSTTQVCTAYPTLGMDCSEHRHCGGGNYCAGSFRCSAPPSLGAPCGTDAATASANVCAADAVCRTLNAPGPGICAKRPNVGEPCLTNEDGTPIAVCASGARCDLTLATPLCVSLSAIGAPCTANECQSGLVCACPNAEVPCTVPRVCTEFRFAGQACGTPGARCHPGFSCTAGRCVPLDSRDTFAANCSH